MRHLILLATLVVSLAGCTHSTRTAAPAPLARFHNGELRIAQLTDIHWQHGASNNDSLRTQLLTILRAQQPDLCILTGDIVTGGAARQGWQDIADIMSAAETDFVVLMGNHDPEQWAKDSIYAFLAAYAPRHIGTHVLHSIGENYSGVLTIAAEESDSTAAALFLLDSGNHYPAPLLSDYDNIHLDQIEWYSATSTQLRATNSGQPVPALAFFHICVPEYALLAADESKYYGHYGEGCCPAEVNSGFFSAALEQGDIMGMFVGHDHANDFVGLWKGIALAYGRQSGVLGNATATPIGCRMITLYEGKRAFDTWIATPTTSAAAATDGEQMFHYPTGITAAMEQEGQYLPAVPVSGTLQQGIHYTYVEGSSTEKTIDAMLTHGIVREEGVMSTIDISHAPAEDHFGFRFEGFFLAEGRGVYVFSMMSDDGSRLLIDGKSIIDLDGSHSATPATGYVALEQGLHTFTVEYFEDYMGEQLDIWLTTRDTPQERLPARLLFCPQQ